MHSNLLHSQPSQSCWQGLRDAAAPAHRYALADDIAEGDPKFLHRVDQLALEVHAALPFARAPAHAAALGRLAALASAAGLELAWAELTPCAPEHEALGCHQARALLLSEQC